MSEVKIDFSGRNGWIALGGVVLLVLVRLMTLGDSRDPELREAIRAELRNELGGQIGRKLETVDTSDAAQIAEITAMTGDEGIMIYAARVSKPLLSFSSNARAIVQVDYAISGQARRSVYWRFDDGLIGGWRYRGVSSAISYYLNFF